MGVETPAGLQGPARLVARNAIRRSALVVHFVGVQASAVGIVSGEVEEVHAGEDDQEPTQQRDRVHGVGGVEAFEEDKRRAQSGRGKRNVV